MSASERGAVAGAAGVGATASDPAEAPRDLRPLVLGATAWLAMWVATSGLVLAWVAAAAALLVVGGVAWVRRSGLLGAVALLGALCLAAGVVRVAPQSEGPLAALARERAVATVTVVLDQASRQGEASGPRPAWWVSNVRVVHVGARDGAWASGARLQVGANGEVAAAWARIPLGSTVRAVVRLEPPDAGEPVVALARAREPPAVVAEAGPVPAAVERVRAGLREAVSGLDPDPRALVPALVVGDTSAMPDDLVERFRTTGLTHLTAVSGANLTLLLAFLRVAAVALGARGRVLTGILVAGVAAFVALCLGEPSVVRAAGMGLVGLAAMGWSGRGSQGLRYLAVAVLALVVLDPWLARSVGFALSVVASLGLLWWAGCWTRVLSRWLPAWLAEAVAVPLAAQLATEPIVVALSGRVSVVGLLANAVAGPLVGPATVLGFLAAGLSVVWLPAARVVAWLAGWCAQGLCWIARLGDALPGAAVPWPATPLAIALVAVACLCASVLLRRVLARPWLVVTLVAAMVAALLRAPAPPGWPPADWLVVSCDVGQGDATVFNAGGGAAVVVDAGPEPRALERCLAPLGVARVPLVALTHLHADHVQGLPALASRRPGLVLTSAVTTPASGERLVAALVSGAHPQGAQRQVAQAGQRWQVGQVHLEVLAAPALVTDGIEAEGESSTENDASLVLRVTTGDVAVLLAGDSEDTGQARLLALGERADVDVLLVPHHGSGRQSPEFLRTTTPEAALVSVGADNDYGHPTARTLKLVEGLGARVFRTDRLGSVAVAGAPGRLRVTSQR